MIAAVPRHLPPYYSTDSKGHPAGFAIDAMNHIRARAGLRVIYRVEEDMTQAAAEGCGAEVNA